MARFQPLADSEMDPAQAEVARKIAAGPRGGVRGPFVPMLHSPDFTDRFQHLGEYVRYRNSLPDELMEVANLITARRYRAQFVWASKQALARTAGVSEEVIAAIGRGERPAGMSEAMAAVHDFVVALHAGAAVPDEIYDAARRRLSERQIIDLVGTCGYYVMMALFVGATETPAPAGAEVPFAPSFAR